MDPNTSKLKDFYLIHQNTCWQEFRHFKETKDKIVFFIGTLFITVLFGSGFLIYKSYELNKIEYDNSILDKLYSVQYLLMHLFFFLLYLYYTYNNVQEKIFLIEAQCCQNKIKDEFKEFSECIPVPFSLIKKYYSDGYSTKTWIKGRNFKDFGNVFLIIIYCIFSLIPLIFKKDFILFNEKENVTELKFNISWIIIGCTAIILLLLVIYTGKILISNIKKEILIKWEVMDINKPNKLKI